MINVHSVREKKELQGLVLWGNVALLKDHEVSIDTKV